MKPVVVINFKNYPETLGRTALQLAKDIFKVHSKKFELIICPNLLATKEVVSLFKKNKTQVFAQHTDPFLAGAYTGGISLSELKAMGVKGTLLNHSERKLPLAVIKETIELCRKKKLITIVCAAKIREIKKIARFQPDFIAYEPKKLIGGQISVTTKPKIILQALKAARGVNLLCGAGIHTPEDLQTALSLGTKGVLIAHAVVQAKNPRKFLEEMLNC